MPLGSPACDTLLITLHAELITLASVRKHILPRASSLLLNLHNVGDHPLVVRILEQGWLQHLPLSLLTHDECRLIERHLASTSRAEIAETFHTIITS
jgi:hypothetical protein